MFPGVRLLQEPHGGFLPVLDDSDTYLSQIPRTATYQVQLNTYNGTRKNNWSIIALRHKARIRREGIMHIISKHQMIHPRVANRRRSFEADVKELFSRLE